MVGLLLGVAGGLVVGAFGVDGFGAVVRPSGGAARHGQPTSPNDTWWAAATDAATAVQLSAHHCSRSAEPEAAYMGSSSSAVANSRWAQAAFSNRAHAPTAAGARLPAAASTS